VLPRVCYCLQQRRFVKRLRFRTQTAGNKPDISNVMWHARIIVRKAAKISSMPWQSEKFARTHAEHPAPHDTAEVVPGKTTRWKTRGAVWRQPSSWWERGLPWEWLIRQSRFTRQYTHSMRSTDCSLVHHKTVETQKNMVKTTEEITRKPCYRKETARCRSYSFRFKVRRQHSLQV